MEGSVPGEGYNNGEQDHEGFVGVDGEGGTCALDTDAETQANHIEADLPGLLSWRRGHNSRESEAMATNAADGHTRAGNSV